MVVVVVVQQLQQDPRLEHWQGGRGVCLAGGLYLPPLLLPWLGCHLTLLLGLVYPAVLSPPYPLNSSLPLSPPCCYEMRDKGR